MIDAPNTPDAASFKLPYPSLQFHGKDTADFLQRQLMNDVRKLQADGDSQWTGLLSAKGKVLHLFLLLRCSNDEFIAVCPDQDASDLQAALQQRVFRSKLNINAMDTASVWHEPAEQRDPAGLILNWDEHRRLSWFRQDRSQRQTDAAAGTVEKLLQTWRLADIEAGIVHISAPIREEFTPQMLGLQRRQAFSLSKGCFPGQEIVARTHYLGKAKRGLRLLACEGSVACGAPILHLQREVGRVVSETIGQRVLAVLPLEQPEPLSNSQASFTYLSPTWAAG